MVSIFNLELVFDSEKGKANDCSVQKLVPDALGVSSVAAVIGGSMGGMARSNGLCVRHLDAS